MPRLTEWEQKILDLASEGMGNALIAERVMNTEKSVEGALSSIFIKLECKGRAQGYVPRVEAVCWNLRKP